MTPLLWAFTLLVVSIGFIILEIFLPSGGILSFLAAAAAVAAVVIVFYCEGAAAGTGFLAVTLVCVPLALNLALKWWPYTPVGRMLLNIPPGQEAEITGVTDYEPLKELVGKRGVAACKMIPSGSINIAGQHFDAVSQAGAIEEGQHVKVISVDGTRILVRAIDASESDIGTNDAAESASSKDQIIPDPFSDDSAP